LRKNAATLVRMKRREREKTGKKERKKEKKRKEGKLFFNDFEPLFLKRDNREAKKICELFF
jgi:hypothetical protein